MKKLVGVLLVALIAISCSEDAPDPFVWNKDQIGYITKETKVYQLDSLYANDSIVNPIKGDEFVNGPGDIMIFEKGGKHLLNITPKEALDSTSTIEFISIKDNRYTTAAGITIESPFKKINESYTISSIDNMIDDAIIWVNEENFYFSIEKDKLPSAVQFDFSAKIEKTMIPDEVQPKSVFISW